MSAGAPPQSAQSSKPQRVLACILCQQRKIKCDRNFPCSNCIKSRLPCVPSTLLQRRRKRRFPERALLDRLAKYEDLLRQNNVSFEPLHEGPAKGKEVRDGGSGDDSDNEYLESTPSATGRSEKGPEARNIWHAMSQSFRDPDNDSDSSNDDIRGTQISKAYDQSSAPNEENLLFASRSMNVDLSTLHPNPVHIFRLWQTYLDNVSIEPNANAYSLSSLLGLTIRIAHRIGIQSESTLAQCTILEAEMRRRLWWAIILFDARIGGRSQSKTVTLEPSWDCMVPLNVSDSDLRPEMKIRPTNQARSEALFAVMRCELGDYVRHSSFYLDFSNPALRPLAKHVQNGSSPGGSGLVKLEESIEEQHFKSLDLENPIHFMTVWTTRGQLAKDRLLEHNARFSNSSAGKTEAQRDAATSYAFRMLECDTKIMTCPLTKRFRWFNRFYFPFPAYIQIVQDVRRRPHGAFARRAWEIMSDNYEVWWVGTTPSSQSRDDSPFVKMLAGIFMGAWEACERASEDQRAPGEILAPPRIVVRLRQALAQVASGSQAMQQNEMGGVQGVGGFPTPVPTPMSFEDQGMTHCMGIQDGHTRMPEGMYSGGAPGELFLDAPMDQLDMDQVDWAAFDAQMGLGPGGVH
ncbi:MAG: hypothetical protein Q9203_004144 [Teloschistes exilis]